MQNFASLKYAELRKLAKKNGVKANLKHEKLVEALTKLYNQDSGGKDGVIQPKDKKNTPAKLTSTPQAKSTTPRPVHASLAKVKSQTPVINTKPASPQQTPKQSTASKTPSSVTKRSSQVKVVSSPRQIQSPLSRAKPSTPVNRAKPSTPVNNRKSVSSPNLAHVRKTPSSGTPAAVSVTKSPGISKISTPVHTKPLTPLRKNNATKLSSGKPSSALGKRKKSEQQATPSSDQPAVKKRRSTLEVPPTPESGTPGASSPVGRRVSGLRTLTEQKTSPRVEAMLGEMKTGMTDTEVKESIMSAIDKKVQAKCQTASSTTGATSSIPRFAAFLAKKREDKKPMTPGNKDWKKIHENQFKKFDSIDVYLDKKRKRAVELTASVKKARTILAEVHAVADKLKGHRTPTMATPASQARVKKSRGSYVSKTTPFKPTVLNINQASFNFGSMKVPQSVPRKSPRSVVRKPPQSTTKSRKSAASALNRKLITTPFTFTATTKPSLNATVASTKKAFNLQESLSRPLTWKPHKGILKSMDHPRSPAHMKAVSTAKTARNRDTRRNEMAEKRANRKENSQMARRGIKM